MKWNKKIVDDAYEKSEDSTVFLLNLYKEAFGKDLWDKIEKLVGFPKAGKELSEYIFLKMIEKDKEVDSNNFTGGIWLNSGFSTERELDPWELILCDYTLLEEL